MSSALHSLVRPVAASANAPFADGAAAVLLDAESRRHAHLVVRVAGEYFALPLDSVTEALEAPPLALAVDELCDVRELPPSSQRTFTGRHDPHGVVRSVALEGDTLIAIVNPAAVRAAMLAAAAAPGVASGFAAAVVLPGSA